VNLASLGFSSHQEINIIKKNNFNADIVISLNGFNDVHNSFYGNFYKKNILDDNFLIVFFINKFEIIKFLRRFILAYLNYDALNSKDNDNYRDDKYDYNKNIYPLY
tara:strand:+ start:362 stop:679 length:318 start_codon:yes stop_codon:yes gene_type:complete